MSLFFLIGFGALCAALYHVCPMRGRWVLLLAVSYAYYAYCGLSAVPFLLLTTLTTWAGALIIGRIGEKSKAELRARKAELSAQDKKRIRAAAKSRQRIAFFAVLLLNFGVLAVVKYAKDVLGLFGIQSPGFLLPLGISFYTFASMGYLIDVYNAKYAPERNPARFALFVSFFPQMIQGPIARYDQLAGQLYEPHRFGIESCERAALLMLWGFFKKKVLADRALPLVESVFANQGEYGGAVIAVAVLFYSLQQYCDFSGGIDLVAGIAELFGIRLAPNFKRPYFAVSLGDFWRRWHISLGAWMRDYVFYPFALTKPMAAISKKLKSRCGADFARAFPAAAGNVLVFLLVGIWHGATGNYVMWGFYNGLILAFSALMEPRYRRFNEKHAAMVRTRGFYVLRVLRTFLIVNIGWYFDRALRAGDAFAMLFKTVADWRLDQIADGVLLTLGVTARDMRILAVGTAIVFGVSLMRERGADVRAMLTGEKHTAVRWAILMGFTLFVLGTFVTTGDAGGFMYALF